MPRRLNAATHARAASPAAARLASPTRGTRSKQNGKTNTATKVARQKAAKFYAAAAPPGLTQHSISQCHALLLGARPTRSGCTTLLSRLPFELVRQICLLLRQPIDDGSAYHFTAPTSSDIHFDSLGSVSIWIFDQCRYARHTPPGMRVVLQHTELPDLTLTLHPSLPPPAPLVTRLLGHTHGFTNRNVLVNWTHRVEASGNELSEWPAACTAEDLHAPPIVPPPRRRSSVRGDRVAEHDSDEANPRTITFATHPATRNNPAEQTTLDLERLCFITRPERERPNVHHTAFSVNGSPSALSFEPAGDSVGDAEECFCKITTGARSREEAQQADEDDKRIRHVMALIEEQREQILRMAMEEEEEEESLPQAGVEESLSA